MLRIQATTLPPRATGAEPEGTVQMFMLNRSDQLQGSLAMEAEYHGTQITLVHYMTAGVKSIACKGSIRTLLFKHRRRRLLLLLLLLLTAEAYLVAVKAQLFSPGTSQAAQVEARNAQARQRSEARQVLQARPCQVCAVLKRQRLEPCSSSSSSSS
jgi:hypothetical protein